MSYNGHMRMPQFFDVSRLASSALVLAALLVTPQNEAAAQRAENPKANIEREGLMFWGSANTTLFTFVGMSGSISYPIFQNEYLRLLARGNVDTTLGARYPRVDIDVLLTTSDGKWYIGPSLNWSFVKNTRPMLGGTGSKASISTIKSFGAAFGYRHLESKKLNYFGEIDLMASYGGVFMMIPTLKVGVTYSF